MASFAEGESRDFSNSTVLAKVDDETRVFDLSLSQLFPTGAELVAGFANDRSRTVTDPTPFVNPAYRSEASLNLTQPLLQGFGKTVTEQAILYAVQDRHVAVQELRMQAFALLTQVRDTYYDILRYRDNMQSRETSVALAEKILAENRSRVKAGVLPPIDILEAEVGLTQRQRDLLDAQRAYQDALDQLAVLLNFPQGIVVGDDELLAPEVQAGEEVGFSAALRNRPDLQQMQREIEKLDIERTVNRNQLLPSLDLTAGYGYSGLGEDYSDDLNSIGSDDLNSWNIGLSVSYPLGNRVARNDLLKTELHIKGQHARLQQFREEVRNEIRTAVRLLEVNRKKIEVARRGRELSEEKLRTLLKRKEVGLATTRDVLQGEDDLAQARTDQIASLADYNQTVTQYLRVSGLLLESEGVALVGLPDPENEKPLLEMQKP
jgi:outer membrane protein TolC